MTPTDYLQIFIYVFLLVLCTPLLGSYIAKVLSGQPPTFSRVLYPLESLGYRCCGIDPDAQMDWKQYAWALTWFSLFGLLTVFALQVFQGRLPLNPEHLGPVSWHLALNTAISFVTNTNWQSYSGENTLSYLSQMLGLGVQNFVSAAVGLSVFAALVRGLSQNSTGKLGNFWVDLIRSTIYIFLPLAFILALLLVHQGVVDTFGSYLHAQTFEGLKQTVPVGPAASQIAIKQLGTNGGGFFGVNSAHPFENPTPFSNFLEMFAILLIPAALTSTFGHMIRSKSQGWTLFAVMLVLWSMALVGSLLAEYHFNPALAHSALMEGKETRFGVVNSLIWSTSTSAASNGSVNAMMSSLSPIAGGFAMFNILLGEIVFGGVGAGLYGMLLLVLLTVFLAGLMVGRSPEYLGKKLEAGEMQMVILAILLPNAAILIGAALSVVTPMGLSSLLNKGPHGLSEILYAFASATNNNGSAFAGLNANTLYYNLILGLAMLIGRFAVIFPVLKIAGRMSEKKTSPPSPGTFATDTPLFSILLVGVILVVGVLTFFPALSLGPVVEHFMLLSGSTF